MKNLVAVGVVVVCLVLGLLPGYQSASAAPQAGTSQNRAPVSAEAGEQIARAYLSANAARLQLTQADLSDLKIDINFADADSGNRYVKFVQQVNGIEIYNAMLNVTVLADGSVLYVGNRGVGNALEQSNTATPTLNQSEAIAAAASALGLTYTPSTVVAEQNFGTVDQKTQYAGGDLSLESMTVRLMYQPLDNGSLRLTWQVDIYQQDGLHWWDVRVDAVTGDLLDRADRAVSENWDAFYNDKGQVPASTTPTHLNGITFSTKIVAPYAPASMVGSYRVFQMPVESPSHATPPAPADGRTLTANPDNATASPFGWHDTNGAAGAEFTTTQGNNTHAYTDVDANNSPDAGSSPDGGAGLVFDFPLDLTQAPSTYRPAAVTNLFYWTNVLHDVSYVHGFNEAARNFQENNYGNGGLGSDYINAEGQDGSEFNNARYFHAAEGSNPRFQMYLWSAPTPDRDGDLDNGIILHEYGHGISLRLTGNGTSCLNNSEQMGEGWSDFQSLMLTQRTGDTGAMGRGVGTYALNQPTTGPGIRPARYSTDMTVNPFTYSNLGTLAIPHGVGFLWNTMLWDMNWKLIDAHGFNANIYGDWSTGGNNLTYRLVHDAMKIQPCSPGFVDGRDTILAADTALTGGDNQCLIWEAFARRGLGFSASQGSPNSTGDGTAAFDLPPQCTGGPTPTPSNTPVPTITATPTTPPTDPDINVTPNAFIENHATPQTTNDTMNIQNVGTGSLTWTITEDDTRPGKIMTARGEYIFDGEVQEVSGFSTSGATGTTIVNTPNVAQGSLFITHSSTQDILTGNSVSCNAGGLHTDNSYYRVYDLAGDFGITQTIEVDEVSFGVEQATGATGTQPVTVNLYTLTGVLNTANLTLIGSEAIDVPDSATGTVFSVPVSPEVTVPAGSVLVVELFTPNGQTAGNSFFIGSNADPETDPSYLRAADCGVAQPTATGSIGFPDMHIVMNVSAGIVGGGACSAPTDIPWLTVAPTNGSTAGGGSTPVTLTYNSATLANGTYTGTLCIASNDTDEALVTVPITLNVGGPTAIDLSSFTAPMGGVNLADLAAAGLLLLAGAVLVLRRK